MEDVSAHAIDIGCYNCNREGERAYKQRYACVRVRMFHLVPEPIPVIRHPDSVNAEVKIVFALETVVKNKIFFYLLFFFFILLILGSSNIIILFYSFLLN